MGLILEQAVVRIMTGSRETLRWSAREAALEAMQPLRGRRPPMALVFSCVSRLAYLGPGAQEEVAAIREEIGSSTLLIGLFSFGEVAAQQDGGGRGAGGRSVRHDVHTVMWSLGIRGWPWIPMR